MKATEKAVEADSVNKSSDDDEEIKTFSKLWKGKLNRKVVKRPVMTTPYGVTSRGIVEQIHEEAEKQELFEKGYQVRSITLANYLTGKVIEGINNTIISAREVMDWLMETSRVAGKADTAMEWRVPKTGFRVVQNYFKIKGKRINLFVGKTRVTTTVDDPEAPTDVLDKGRQTSGISPNFIHSLDAAALMLTCNKLVDKGIKHFAFIHDSYGTHASNVGVLHQLLREAFVELYQEPVLEMFKQEQEERLGIELKELPEKGDLDINQVRNSNYFFA